MKEAIKAAAKELSAARKLFDQTCEGAIARFPDLLVDDLEEGLSTDEWDIKTLEEFLEGRIRVRKTEKEIEALDEQIKALKDKRAALEKTFE